MLFEYDNRFKTFGADFIQYDYKFPLNVPRNMSSQFDLVIADPPFLSVECLTKTTVTVKFLAKKNIVLCTGICTITYLFNFLFAFYIAYIYYRKNEYNFVCIGAVMTELAERLLDVRKCDFIPGHRNNLANEFCCFSNFDFDRTLE